MFLKVLNNNFYFICVKTNKFTQESYFIILQKNFLFYEMFDNITVLSALHHWRRSFINSTVLTDY